VSGGGGTCAFHCTRIFLSRASVRHSLAHSVRYAAANCRRAHITVRLSDRPRARSPSLQLILSLRPDSLRRSLAPAMGGWAPRRRRSNENKKTSFQVRTRRARYSLRECVADRPVIFNAFRETSVLRSLSVNSAH
jgi:hypothetical protein